MKKRLTIVLITAGMMATGFSQEQARAKKEAQILEKEQVQTLKQNQIRVLDNGDIQDQTKLQIREQKQIHKFVDLDGDGINDVTMQQLDANRRSNNRDDIGHGQGAGAMKRQRDRDQDGKMAPGSGAGPKGQTPRTQKGDRKGQK